jgi:hypothetical protein
MVIKKFNQYIKEDASGEKYLLYYAFDWDDNILSMPTVIHMEHLIDGEWVPEDVSTADFTKVRGDSENWRIINGDPTEAFSEFRDSGPRGDNAFLEDAKKAISAQRFSPAWEDFVECLVNGSLFAIITARGHEAPPMRKGVEWIIDNVLSEEQLYEMYNNLMKFAYLFKHNKEYDRILKGQPSVHPLVQLYLDNCEFVGVSAPSRGSSATNPEQAKEDALLLFMDRVDKFAASIGYKAKVGFSDDDLGNVSHIENLADNIHHEKFPNILSFVVKGTKYPEEITKKVVTFDEFKDELTESMDPMASSTMSMQTPNAAMSAGLNSKDPFVTRAIGQSKLLTKMSKNTFGKGKKKD